MAEANDIPIGSVITSSEKGHRLVETRRPLETLFVATGLKPKDLVGKNVLDAGSGKNHWGLDLTTRYGVVAGKYENLSIHYGERSKAKQLAGRLFLAEQPGNIRENLPYKDNEFDVVWNSYAPTNFNEFIRVTREGGRIFILGSDYTDEHLANLRSRFPNCTFQTRTVSEEEVAAQSLSIKDSDKNALREVTNKTVLTITKNPTPQA